MTEPALLLQQMLRQAGLPPSSVLWASEPAPGATPPPEGPWVIVPYGAQFVVGAVGRGKLATYEALWTPGDAVDLAIHLASTPLPLRVAGLKAQEMEVGRTTGDGILERTLSRAGAAGPARLEVGQLVDLIGPETGHHLYALGTSFPMRSQPPSDVGAAYRTFRVAQPMPEEVREGSVAPWFGQRGGGAMVVLDRPTRWYVDQGFLAATDGVD